MTNRLTKDLSVLTATAPVLVDPGTPYVPGYWAYETRTVLTYVVGFGYQYVDTLVPVYHPPVPAVAPTYTTGDTVLAPDIGWNAGAHSITPAAGSMRATFKIGPASVGVMCGLGHEWGDEPYMLQGVRYGVQWLDGELKIIYDSTPIYTVPAFALADQTFTIERWWGRNPDHSYASGYAYGVRWYADSTLLYERWDYTMFSAAFATLLSGFAGATEVPYNLRAALYVTGDYVDEPTLTSLLGMDLAFEPMAMLGGTAGMEGANLAFVPVVGAAGVFYGSDLSFEPLSGYGGIEYASASLSFEELTLTAYSVDYHPEGGTLTFVPMTIAATLLVGEVGTVDVSFQPLAMLAADRAYGDAQLTMEAMTMYAHAYEGPYAAFAFSGAVGSGSLLFTAYFDVLLTSSVDSSAELVSVRMPQAALVSAVTSTPTLTAQGDFSAVMDTLVNAFAGVPLLTEAGEVWVVNEEEGGASSMYENYSFSSYAVYQGQAVGVRADGVYVLDGDDDAGTPIRASVALGTHDFGTTLGKTVTGCYIGTAGGHVWLKIIANDTEYLYKTVRTSAALDTQRIKPGMGLKANYFTFELHNDAGADFELASVEFQAVQLSRRI